MITLKKEVKWQKYRNKLCYTDDMKNALEKWCHSWGYVHRKRRLNSTENSPHNDEYVCVYGVIMIFFRKHTVDL